VSGRQTSALAALIALVLLLAAGGAYYALREQRAANTAILASLDRVQSALDQEASRSRELAEQVSALAERTGRLERDNRDLRRQLAALLRRKPVEVARLPMPLEGVPLVPLAEPAVAYAEPVIVEPLPITWATDFRSYQPAGLIAPSPAIVLTRRLADPAFLKKMYIGYGALQAADIATTLVSIDGGARETNPLMVRASRNPAALIGIKAGASVATILLVEKLRKASPIAATISLIVINSTLAAVVVNNTAVAVKQ
jgi:hypothetical protein